MKCVYKIALDCHLLHQELQCLSKDIHSLPTLSSELGNSCPQRILWLMLGAGKSALLSGGILPFGLVLWFQDDVSWGSCFIVEPIAILITLLSKHQSHGWVYSNVTHSTYIRSEPFSGMLPSSSRASFLGGHHTQKGFSTRFNALLSLFCSI